MLVTDEILYDILKETFPVHRCGRILPDHSLRLPVFYAEGAGLQRDQVYILKTQDLPASPEEECLYICIGPCPAAIPDSYCGEVFYIDAPGAGIPDVFNHTQRIFSMLLDWEARLQRILTDSADIKEMVRVSIPVFENRMIVVDCNLQTIAFCQSVDIGGQREIRMSEQFDSVPEAKAALFRSSYYSMREIRHPFRYSDGVSSSYCINLYQGGSYVGVCSLTEDIRPFRESDFSLFWILAEYLQRAITLQACRPDGRALSMRTILSRILHGLPVDRKDMDAAVSERQHASAVSSPVFRCIAVRSRDLNRTLPSEYLCSVFEALLPAATAVEYEETLAVFCCTTLNGQKKLRDLLTDRMTPVLKEMNFLAGVSDPFTDIGRARSGYLQADCALNTGGGQDRSASLFYYDEYALNYMLNCCCGELSAREILPSGLQGLMNSRNGSSDIETLRCYLDNECNASRTAEAMYLHRSSLTPRLERIRSYVNLDTPEQRLYLRICLHMTLPAETAQESGRRKVS